MTAKKPTPAEIEKARKIVADADKAEADERIAEAQKRADEREARLAKLRAITSSPAYQEVKEKLTALVPEFVADGTHVAYLANALHSVESIAG